MRIRTIKPDWWCHPVMARLPSEVQLLGLALLNYADDEGYFRAEADLVRAACAPFCDNATEIVRRMSHLRKVGFICVEVCDKQGAIGKIINFSKHQKVDHAKGSQLKTYFEAHSTKRREKFAKRRAKLAPEWKGMEGNGKEGNACAGEVVLDSHEAFEAFWKLYPKKRDRVSALKAWNKLKLDDVLLDTIMAAVDAQKASEDWKKESGKFIPYPATWLNGQRWLDDFGKPADENFTPEHEDITEEEARKLLGELENDDAA